MHGRRKTSVKGKWKRDNGTMHSMQKKKLCLGGRHSKGMVQRGKERVRSQAK